MSLIRTDAIVLRRYPLGEEDRILTLFGRDTGKVRAVAKGALKSRNRWMGTLEIFNYVSIILFISKSKDLLRVNQADLKLHFKNMPNSLARLAAGFEVCEILDRYMPDADPNDQLFDSTIEILSRINDSSAPEFFLRLFHFRFLALSGYQLQTNRCLGCSKPRNQKSGFLSAERGGVLCKSCSQSDHDAIFISSKSLNLIENIMNSHTWNSATPEALPLFAAETEKFMIAYFLNNFDRSPRSNHIFDSSFKAGQIETDLRTPSVPDDPERGV